jgi:hypothetical protein
MTKHIDLARVNKPAKIPDIKNADTCKLSFPASNDSAVNTSAVDSNTVCDAELLLLYKKQKRFIKSKILEATIAARSANVAFFNHQ